MSARTARTMETAVPPSHAKANCEARRRRLVSQRPSPAPIAGFVKTTTLLLLVSLLSYASLIRATPVSAVDAPLPLRAAPASDAAASTAGSSPVKRRTSSVTLSPEEQEEVRRLYRPQHASAPPPRHPGTVRVEDLPALGNSQERWMSLDPQVEFIPAAGADPAAVRRFLEQSGAEDGGSYSGGSTTDNLGSIYNVEPFAYGVDEYDEYQQAWRLLGFIVDCNPMVDDDYYGGGSGDGGTEDGCARYVLWAAYVDLDYQGGGIGEYQYWDRYNNKWDTTACDYSGSSRCAKMDCHLESTHFSLLGFFKHKSYDDWMEQLFKHEGICVWSDEEYAFMKNARKGWPQGCIGPATTASDGTDIYYDVKPVRGGDIVVGLYTDTKCIKEYDGSDSSVTVEAVLGNFLLNGGSGSGDNGNYDFSGDSLSDSYSRWNTGLGTFHTCQPCVAYDLENVDGSTYSDNGYGDKFECYDDAGYTNVNQCMKFMAKTKMNTATFRDMSLGRYQGTLVATPLNGFNTSSGSWKKESWSNRLTYLFLAFAVSIFLYGFIYFLRAKHQTRYQPTWGWNAKEPLVVT